MNIAIGCDHAGFELKTKILAALRDWGHEVEDVGTDTTDPVDFPDIAQLVGERITSGSAERGVMLCGSGIGACMAANKIPGIRAALCHDVYSAHQSVEHDDANVICLGAFIVGPPLALDLLRTYLDARFRDEEHFRRRVEKMSAMEVR